MDYQKPDAKKLQNLKDMANKFRVHAIETTTAAGTGHPTSCCSCAEILSVLFFNTMQYKVKEPRDPNSDRFVMSKGHACPALYAAWAEAGLFPVSDLMNLRKIDSDLEGHPTPRLDFVDVATGSLGQGLSCACGMAYNGKYWDKSAHRVFCLMGDGETAEGSVWEAFSFAGTYKLDNLVAILDVNRLGQSDPTAFQHDLDVYKKRVEAFGWNAYVVDGHEVEELAKALYDASTVKERPSCIIAKTFKGKGIPGVENLENFHGKPLGAKSAAAIEAIKALIANDGPHGLCPQTPVDDVPAVDLSNMKLSSPPSYTLGQKVAGRSAYGTALKKLGDANPRVVAMDGDVKNSTFAQVFQKAHPERFIECFIAEQNLIGVGIGAGCRNRNVVFCSSFAAFFTRAFDQLRMGAISQTNINIAGSHCGVSIGADGPSQMALEDIAMFRSIPGCTVFYPTDGVSTEYAVELAANTPGICFIRTSRPDTAVMYPNDEKFEIGKAKVVRQSDNDAVTVIGAAVTLTEALKAYNELKDSGIHIRVIDPFTIKPIDAETIISSAKATGGRIVTVEDHYLEGGIGEAVMAAVSEERDIVVRRLAVSAVPRSGKCDELLDMYGISAPHIIRAVKEIMKL